MITITIKNDGRVTVSVMPSLGQRQRRKNPDTWLAQSNNPHRRKKKFYDHF